MPKPKRGKRKNGRVTGLDNRAGSEDEYDTSDNISVMSSQSDVPSVLNEALDSEIDDTCADDVLDDKLRDCIDNITEKSMKVRTDALKALTAAMSKKLLSESLLDRKLTLSDALERCLKRGKGDEQTLATLCLTHLCIQLGNYPDDCVEIYNQITPTLKNIISDKSASLKGRTAATLSLGILTFVTMNDTEVLVDNMSSFEKVFSASYLKGDKTVPSVSPETACLHAAALSSWSLLVSILPPNYTKGLITSYLIKFQQILLSSDLDLRIAAGEAIALLYESARGVDENYVPSKHIHLPLVETLRKMSTDSQRSHAKKDRRQQRSSFRDILGAIEDWETPSCLIKFSQEELYIDSWSMKRQYDSLSHVMGAGMNTHLSVNDLMRDIFNLGPAGLREDKTYSKASKQERHYYNAAAFKARTKARGKFRDKRIASIGDN